MVENFYDCIENHDAGHHDGVESEVMVEDFYLEENGNWDTGHDGVKTKTCWSLRGWMYEERMSACWVAKWATFSDFAVADMKSKGNVKMCCPYDRCRNTVMHLPVDVEMHHGEVAVEVDSGFEEEHIEFNQSGEEYRGDDAMDEETPVDEAPRGWMGEMLDDVHLQNQLQDPDNATDEKKFQKLVEDANTPVYDNAGINNNVLEVTLELLRIKAKSGLSDKGFTEISSYLATVFPEGNKLPKSTYEAKNITCPLGLDVVKYHACPMDCIVYTGPHKNKGKCPICGTSRYKKKDGNHDEVDEEEVRKGRPAKIVWYLPMGSRFVRWFQNLKDAVKEEYFTLRAALLTCVHDYPANGNTSCQCTKGYKACTKCAENTISEMLPTSHKIVYMGHRRWLHPKDPWRLDAESFNGKEEHEGKLREKSGFEIYDIVKDLEVRSGKAENVKDKDGPDTSIWMMF
ncbi:uncharacterized protein LOC104584833 [Brachypodium distachyon]|uniref:uncharacterized protein LOC104584833 n=1 Tax=Brachypodium distachyon TaxID=15368 RepID=UPI0005300316|nr:uncharacterized protein LOC104584833 [Brachypodium distachyon]|eukprot:XP_010238868.1 uncharacterized protein LOC104584833 [Brachypodium distachyon]